MMVRMSALPVDDNEEPKEERPPRLSASLIGAEHNLTPVESNFLFKLAGFLEGEPGNWHVTQKGKPYANETIDGRGTGGSLIYNPSWGLRSWNTEIVDQLDTSPERIREVREAAAEDRRRKAELKAAKAAELDEEDNDDGVASDAGLDTDVLKWAGGLVLAAAAAYGAWKAAPHVKRWCTKTVVPRIKNVKARVTGASDEGSKPDDGDAAPPA